MTDKTGGAAFPQSMECYGGLTIRDWFAGQIVGHVIQATKSDTREEGETHEQMFARRAYAIADALLSARKE